MSTGFRPLSGYSFSNLTSRSFQLLHLGFRPLSGYSFSNNNEVNNKAVFLLGFRPLSGYSFSNF